LLNYADPIDAVALTETSIRNMTGNSILTFIWMKKKKTFGYTDQGDMAELVCGLVCVMIR
jgi:hypothetical protein